MWEERQALSDTFKAFFFKDAVLGIILFTMAAFSDALLIVLSGRQQLSSWVAWKSLLMIELMELEVEDESFQNGECRVIWLEKQREM